MRDEERDEIVQRAGALRAASRVSFLPSAERKRLEKMDEDECARLFEDPIETLRWAGERMAKNIDLDEEGTRVHFAIRVGITAVRKAAEHLKND